MTYELAIDKWKGTDDGSAPEGYYLSAYRDDAWRRLGFAGDCPDTFTDEALARRVAGAIVADQHGVVPMVTVEATPENEAG